MRQKHGLSVKRIRIRIQIQIIDTDTDNDHGKMKTHKCKLLGKEREMRQKIRKHRENVEREEKLCKRVLASCCHQTPIDYTYIRKISNTHLVEGLISL